jgi:nitrate reductase gamma subunit
MEALRLLVTVILPYFAIVVFIVAMISRIRTWLKLPSPPITLFPAPLDEAANKLNAVKEALFFPSLFNGDRVLWLFAWVFHAVLLLIFVGHFRVFTNVDAILVALGMSEEAILAMSSGAGGAAGVLVLVALVLLFLRRLAYTRIREITGTADYLALLLIGAIIVTGNMMRFGAEHFDLALTREYFAGLATFANVREAAALSNNLFVVHMCLGFLLLLCMPFSKLLHFGGIFFTQQLVRKH